MISDYVPLLIFLVISFLVVGALVTASFLIGPSKPNQRKLQVYESGIVPTTPARHRLSVRFYLTAMLLLHVLRWYGIAEMFVFMLVLLVALAHIWRKGGLEWE
ncbi:MAG: hypothetical protein E6J02_04140 [Chloroflexi bacterium]|nr:MAG: hypothetical protein E6J02_04140 [Chloroflexota bacterium]